MKRGIAVLFSVGALLTVGYFTVSKWAIRHETITFLDPERDNRPVAVDIAVRRDKEMQANAGMMKLPDAIQKVVTMDNLRVPFITSGKFKILSFRSTDPQFKADPGVVPSTDICEKAGITVVNTNFQHN